ncbi:MAG TPA: FUSC family protein [Acidimicrobiales bacterium]|nr:FUSC family protein [Acidimicrobiales bacterium]
MATIAAVLEAEWFFVHLTHALQIPNHGLSPTSAAAAHIAVANHEYLVIMMLVGAIIGMISAFGVMDPRARGQLVTTLLLPIPMLSALALGIALGGHRVLSLILLAVVLAVGTYCRRFGPRGMVAGLLLFMGFFFGFFLHAAVTVDDLGWLAASIGVAVLVSLAIRFALFYPRQKRALERTQRSYGARARMVASLALELFDNPSPSERGGRRLHHHLVRLNEAALMIDAQLGDPGAVAEGSSGQLLHQRLFDTELALTNVARFAEAMVRLDMPADQRAEVRLALAALARSDGQEARIHATLLMELLDAAAPGPSDQFSAAVVVPHRFAGSVIALAEAGTEWLALATTEAAKGAFQPAVMLFGGWLPGSAQVSAAASTERGARWPDRIRLAPYTRAAIQMGVAVGIATALGVLVDSYRFYWAVIAVFITFMGVNNAGEQARKALFRVGGTVVGIGIGSLIAEAVGHNTYGSIAVILVALFFGLYLMRINYAFMVVGITVVVSQLYVQLGEFSNSLLGVRLEETALGAAVAIAVVMVVLPLRTRRVLRIAFRDHIQAVGAAVEHASGRLLSDEAAIDTTLRADGRSIDVTYQAILATAQPLRRNLFGSVDEDTGRAMRLAFASRNYSRNLVADVEATGSLDTELRSDLESASTTLQRSVRALAGAVTGPRDVIYTRSSALFDGTERYLETTPNGMGRGQLAIRDLKLIDGAMAGIAEVMALRVTDYDTVA